MPTHLESDPADSAQRYDRHISVPHATRVRQCQAEAEGDDAGDDAAAAVVWAGALDSALWRADLSSLSCAALVSSGSVWTIVNYLMCRCKVWNGIGKCFARPVTVWKPLAKFLFVTC